jgi:hypothetical protein
MNRYCNINTYKYRTLSIWIVWFHHTGACRKSLDLLLSHWLHNGIGHRFLIVISLSCNWWRTWSDKSSSCLSRHASWLRLLSSALKTSFYIDDIDSSPLYSSSPQNKLCSGSRIGVIDIYTRWGGCRWWYVVLTASLPVFFSPIVGVGPECNFEVLLLCVYRFD